MRLIRAICVVVIGACAVLCVPATARAQDRLCDTQFEDCRAPVLTLIQNELKVCVAENRPCGLDVAFWYMADARYSNLIVDQFHKGLPVRVLMDDRADESKPTNTPIIQQLKSEGIPMRKKNGGGILHWKMMLFHGQNTAVFSKANFSEESYVVGFLRETPCTGCWDDEAVFFTKDDKLTNTFRTKFEDMWTDTSGYADYANITAPLVRKYPISTPDPSLNFNVPPGKEFGLRSVEEYNKETAGTGHGIDVIVFRATDDRHADAMIAAVKRGVPVRLIHDPQQYRATLYWRDAYNIDRMYAAGISNPISGGPGLQIKQRTAERGLTHEAAVIMHGLGEVIFGSQNWEGPNSQANHNYFYTPAINKVVSGGKTFYQWFADQFEGKWNDPSAFADFQPLPPDPPTYASPANGAASVPFTVTLNWEGGYWAHRYDIYLGTSSTPPLMASNVNVGSPAPGTPESFSIENLAPNTTYYWKIVGKTMAGKATSGPTWSFRTVASNGGTATNVVMYAGRAPTVAGTWQAVSDATAAGASRMSQPDKGAGKVTTPSASPANYFEIAFNAQAGVPYQLWMRGRAQGDSTSNDSAWFQFTNTVNGSGTPSWRIGSASGVWAGVEECSGCLVQGWGWHDNGWGIGVRGEPIYFATTGVQRVRVQQREDGLSIDQIVLSPTTYRTASPGLAKNDTTILPEAGVASGTPPPPGIDEIVVHAKSGTAVGAAWVKESDASAADGIKVRNPDKGAAKLGGASASPASYFEVHVNVDAGKPYHLWLRMKADNNSTTNDSVFVQFTNSRDETGASAWRIGTTSALIGYLEEGSGAGVSGWGWADNAYGYLGNPVYFATSGPQTIRVQAREDGVSIDQIVLSAAKYVSGSPGALKNSSVILPEVN